MYRDFVSADPGSRGPGTRAARVKSACQSVAHRQRCALALAPRSFRTARCADALTVPREAEVLIAVVHDEYGHIESVVTLADAHGSSRGWMPALGGIR